MTKRRTQTSSAFYSSAFYSSALIAGAALTLASGCFLETGYGEGRGAGEQVVPLNETIYVGSFEIALGNAYYGTIDDGYDAESFVEIDFEAHNLSTEAERPLNRYYSDGLLLDIGGTYAFGNVTTDRVPGLLSGVGTMSWEPDFAYLSEGDVLDAILSIGGAQDTNVIVPLGAPGKGDLLHEFAVNPPPGIENIERSRFTFDSATVRYNSIEDNSLAPYGAAYLDITGQLSANPEMEGGSEYWGSEDMFLERPDGIAVLPDYLSKAISSGDREDIFLNFELSQPVSGTYTLGTKGHQDPTVYRTVEIP